MLLSRRGLIGAGLAMPAVITRPGLLMPVRRVPFRGSRFSGIPGLLMPDTYLRITPIGCRFPFQGLPEWSTISLTLVDYA